MILHFKMSVVWSTEEMFTRSAKQTTRTGIRRVPCDAEKVKKKKKTFISQNINNYNTKKANTIIIL